MQKQKYILILLISCCLLLHIFFPAKTPLDSLLVTFGFLVGLPLAFLVLVLKTKPAELGLSATNLRKGILPLIFSIILIILISYGLLRFTNFSTRYAPVDIISPGFFPFLFSSIFLYGTYSFINEFFFRGFLMLFVFRNYRAWSILMQFLVFFLYLFIGDALHWGSVSMILTSVFSGWIAYQTRSIYLSTIFSWIITLGIDIVLLKFI